MFFPDRKPQKPVLVIIGTLPPPVGGVTSHIENLLKRLLTTPHTDFDVLLLDCYKHSSLQGRYKFESYSLKADFWALISRLMFHRCIFHLHVSDGKNSLPMLFVIKALWGKARLMITFHDGGLPQNFLQWPFWLKMLWKIAISTASLLICVSQQQVDFLTNALAMKQHTKFFLIPSYIHVQPTSPIPASEWPTWIQAWGAPFAFCLGCSGYGYDYYGYHDVIRSVRKLREAGYNIGLSILLYGKADQDYLSTLKTQTENDQWVFFHPPLPKEAFHVYLRQLDLYVRATRIDSYGLTVAEALDLGTPVVASDVCERTAGTLIYKAENNNDLQEKIRWVLTQNSFVHKPKEQPIDFFDRILACYQQCLKN